MRRTALCLACLFLAPAAPAADFDDLSCGTYLRRHQDPGTGHRFVNLLRGYLIDRGFISIDEGLERMDEVLRALDDYCLNTSPYEGLINAAQRLNGAR